MATIPIRFSVQGSADVTRAMAGMVDVFRRGQADMVNSARSSSQQITQIHNRLFQNLARLHNQSLAEWGRTESRMTAVTQQQSSQRHNRFVAEGRARTMAATQAAAAVATQEGRITQAVQQGAGARANVLQTQARNAVRNAEEVARANIRAAQETSRAWSRVRGGPTGGGGAGGAGGGPGVGAQGPGMGYNLMHVGRAVIGGGLQAGLGYAMDIHGQIQAARHTRAAQHARLNVALGQVGAGRVDSQSAMARVSSFAASNGMSTEELTEAIASAQASHNVLGSRAEYTSLAPGMRSGLLQRRLGDVLQSSARARNLGVSPTEFLRLQGQLRRFGITGNQAGQTMSNFVAMAHEGSVEVDDVLRSGREALSREAGLAASRLGTGATAEQRAAASNTAVNRTYAELQFLNMRGLNVRRAGRSLSNMDTALEGNDSAMKMRNNLQVALGRAPAGSEMRGQLQSLLQGSAAIFEEDPAQRGQYRLREGLRGNALALSQRLNGSGIRGTTFANLFAGGGRGNARSLQQDWRTINTMLTDTMAGPNGENESGFQAVQRIQGARISADDEARMTELHTTSDQYRLNQEEERRINALRNPASEQVRRSDRFAAWSSANPMERTGLQHGMQAMPSILATVGASFVGPIVTQLLPRMIPTIVPLMTNPVVAGIVATAAVATIGATMLESGQDSRIGRERNVIDRTLTASTERVNQEFRERRYDNSINRDMTSGSDWSVYSMNDGMRAGNHSGLGTLIGESAEDRTTRAVNERAARAMAIAPESTDAIGQAVARALAANPLHVTTDPIQNATERNMGGDAPSDGRGSGPTGYEH